MNSSLYICDDGYYCQLFFFFPVHISLIVSKYAIQNILDRQRRIDGENSFSYMLVSLYSSTVVARAVERDPPLVWKTPPVWYFFDSFQEHLAKDKKRSAGYDPLNDRLSYFSFLSLSLIFWLRWKIPFLFSPVHHHVCFSSPFVSFYNRHTCVDRFAYYRTVPTVSGCLVLQNVIRRKGNKVGRAGHFCVLFCLLSFAVHGKFRYIRHRGGWWSDVKIVWRASPKMF